MVVIRNAAFPGKNHPFFTDPVIVKPKPDVPEIEVHPAMRELEEFCLERGISRRAFERAVNYPDLFARLRGGLKPTQTTITRWRETMRGWAE